MLKAAARRTMSLASLGLSISMVALGILMLFRFDLRLTALSEHLRLWSIQLDQALKIANEAKVDMERICETHLQHLADFFASKKANAKDFAYNAPSIFALISGQLEAHVKREFDEQIFTLSQLLSEIEKVESGCQRTIALIKNEVISKIDGLEGFSRPLLAGVLPDYEGVHRDTLQVSVEGSRKHVLNKAVTDIASLFIGQVTARTLERITARLAVSAFLRAGPFFSTGIGFVIGCAIDWIISLFWDPAAQLERELISKLDEVHRLIVFGSPEVTGLRRRLQELIDTQTQAHIKGILSNFEASRPSWLAILLGQYEGAR